MSRERRESYKYGLRLFLCLKGSDKFEQEVFEALYEESGDLCRWTACVL